MVRCNEIDFLSRFGSRIQEKRNGVVSCMCSWRLTVEFTVFRELNETITVMVNQMSWTRRQGLLGMSKV